MTPSDKHEFAEVLRATLSMYRVEASKEALAMWWAATSDLTIDQFRQGLTAHIKGKRGHFPPLPADVLQNARGMSGHLSTEEAWALALESTDEAVTVVWTDEIAQAKAAAQPCLEAGDKFGASKAFASAYERIVASANPVPVWKVSLGDDKSHRVIALESAHKAGRLTGEQVRHFLPPRRAEGPVVALLAGKTEGLDPRWHELGERLRAEKAERDQAAEAERLQKIQAFNAHRQAVLDSLEARNG